MKAKWYGVFAFNGLGVYTNYGKYLNDRCYMQGEHIKGFGEKEEAENFAIDGFGDLCGAECIARTIPNLDCMRFNFFYFFRRGRETRG